jgi:hypothetical protein
MFLLRAGLAVINYCVKKKIRFVYVSQNFDHWACRYSLTFEFIHGKRLERNLTTLVITCDLLYDNNEGRFNIEINLNIWSLMFRLKLFYFKRFYK